MLWFPGSLARATNLKRSCAGKGEGLILLCLIALYSRLKPELTGSLQNIFMSVAYLQFVQPTVQEIHIIACISFMHSCTYASFCNAYTKSLILSPAPSLSNEVLLPDLRFQLWNLWERELESCTDWTNLMRNTPLSYSYWPDSKAKDTPPKASCRIRG